MTSTTPRRAEPSVGVRAVLADGQVALVRQLTPDDQDEVLRLHENLSERDRYFRFFGPLPSRLSDLVFTMSAPLNDRHGSMGAFLDGALVGAAQYAVLADPTTAEVALAVADTTQAHGVGTLLLEHLVSLARRHGVRRFVADVLSENVRMLRVFRDCGLPCRTRPQGSVTTVDLVLDEIETYLDAVAMRERTADAASLRTLLRPRSVVVIGAGRRRGSVGHAVLENILSGGFTGQVYAVNPHVDEILGVPAYLTVGDVPAAPDLAVICVPAAAVPDIAEQCGQHGVRALVVITAGLTGAPELRERLIAAVRHHGMRMVGPNCVGIANSDPGVKLDATFAPPPAPVGSIGLVTQSGGVGIAMREQLGQLGLGLSVMVSAGDKYDVSGNDLLMWWQQDAATRAIALYLESFGNPRKFARLARAVSRVKPIVAVRTGNSEAAQQAAASHTAAAATPTVTRDALFRQAGVITVDTPAELVNTLAALTWQPLPAGNRIAVVTNAGGAGVLAADAGAAAGVTMAELSADTLIRLRALLPDTASFGNPVDTTAAVDVDTFQRCVAAVRADPGVDAVIAATVRTAVGDPIAALGTVAEGDKPLVAVRLGQRAAVAALTDIHGRPTTASYADPAEAVAVLGRMATYARWRERANPLASLPADVDVPTALQILRDKLCAEPGGGWLDPVAVAAVLGCFGIPMVSGDFTVGADEAVASFRRTAGPVVLKAVADGVVHKSSHGGVILDVRDEDGVRAAVAELIERFGDALRGVLVQPLAAGGRELLVGVHADDVFGPLVVFGLGGVDTDLVADRTARLAPLGEADVDDLLAGLRSSAKLFGPDATVGLDVRAARDVLLRIGLLAQLLPEIVELDLNPLILRTVGCDVVDARIRVAAVEPVDPFLPALRG
ncbi:MAG TPA: GNAT family N-acetyltransferase [Pseudonocardiaceae bacterium]|nr:GNAT family N-acetyltransferase [Pseudonocardiaceae bacterium]